MAAPSSRRVSVLFAATALRVYTSSSRAAALALPETLFAAFFVGGLLLDSAGAFGPWVVLAAALFGFAVRRIDIENWTLFIPGGLTGRVERAFGPRAATATACTTLLERILLAALACVVFGHYCASFVFTLTEYSIVLRKAGAADLASVAALVMLGWLWLRARRGPLMTPAQRARYVWIAVAILLVLFIAALVTAIVRRAAPPLPSLATWWNPSLPWRRQVELGLWTLVAVFAALGRAGSAIGVADSIPRAAHELEPPRIAGLRRTVRMTGAAALLFTAGLSFLLAAFADEASHLQWTAAPLEFLTTVVGPHWLAFLLRPVVVVASALLLGQTGRAGMWGAEAALLRLAERGAISPRFQEQDPRFGRYQTAINAVVVAVAVAVLLSGASITWLATAYATTMLWTLAVQAAALGRLSFLRQRRAVKSVGVGLAACAVAMLLRGEAGAVAATAALVSMTVVFARHARHVEEPTPDADAESLLVSSQILSSDLPERPGSILVPVRNPHLLSHLTAALRTSREHEVVVMTARLIGSDGVEEADSMEPTPSERALFARVIAIAERFGRPVRLVIVPAHDVFDAVISTVIRMRASDVYVGESTSISADAQARLLGEAWERAEMPELQVRLVIFHSSGRSDIFHLGPHAPELGPRDLELIHRMWLDASKSAGPHVHHHDIVRAALNTMAEQLSGPGREDALTAIRAVARPADELAAVLRERDYQRLRDMVRNRPASDLAELLADLSLDEQAIAFRLLPRKEAAETFEYLEQDAREALLKTLSKEDVAAILNNMAPDDRTTFLEELPATVTRELLSLLSAQERAIAVTLLGYPEKSIGRLMTPDYVAVREGWTIQQVLDYVRTHGHDSETLNVIYVVDDDGMLIDDIRIREILLADPARRVAEIMDRHFVALKATDDQQEAVNAFRQFDRTALPVTDTAGVLIGIVTVDDVLDVVETEATEDIQRIGGSEALDEPYMEISFLRMIQKRAGWLTALFLGEMLTATAMGFFENEINKAVVLALFVPLIISSGGNSGSQASTLVIRALALGELTLRDWWRVMRRELGAGLALGAILAIIGFLRITVWSAFSDIYGQHWLLVAFTVAFALIGVVMWGTLIGSLLPMALRRMGFDPATSSAPFVATLVDVTGLIIYFSVALVVLRGTLL
ncbi:MAG TPA: magnesium transporter [Vicinamibacterales bacterium]|nr:magnesium transporter [Vicinamibacterales bacterium]